MTADEIRAEAIERIAGRLCEIDQGDELIIPLEDHPERMRELYAFRATKLVDALGDLLPTRIEWAMRNTVGGASIHRSFEDAAKARDRVIEKARTEIPWDAPHERFERIETRYTTDWVEVTE